MNKGRFIRPVFKGDNIMSKSLLQTANVAEQIVTDGGVVNPGVIVRRYGPNCNLNGNA